jgi:hypothetical protein
MPFHAAIPIGYPMAVLSNHIKYVIIQPRENIRSQAGGMAVLLIAVVDDDPKDAELLKESVENYCKHWQNQTTN